MNDVKINNIKSSALQKARNNGPGYKSLKAMMEKKLRLVDKLPYKLYCIFIYIPYFPATKNNSLR